MIYFSIIQLFQHNSYRSFLGLTCLIQISTRKNDYIIDPFPIWNEVWILNEPFTNPNILKVLFSFDSFLNRRLFFSIKVFH